MIAFVETARPVTVAEIVREMRVERSHVYQILRGVYGRDFRRRWPAGKKFRGDDFPHITRVAADA